MTANRTYMFLAGEDMITERINSHVAGIQSADFGGSKHLRNRRPRERESSKDSPHQEKQETLNSKNIKIAARELPRHPGGGARGNYTTVDAKS